MASDPEGISRPDLLPSAPVSVRRTNVINGLVLQGGGALGAFELGVIEWLLENGIKLDVVSGVSIGAINAAVLCGHRHPEPRAALRQLWADLTTLSLPPPLDPVNGHLSIFGNPGMYLPRTDYLNLFNWTSFYDTAPLRTTLARLVDFDKLGPPNFHRPQRAPRLILTATNLSSGRLDRFDSKQMQLDAAHVLASGSLPPSFPPTLAAPPEAGDQQPYWDGGLFDNTPLSKVISALQESNDPHKTMYVVTLFPSQAPLPRNIPEVVTRMMTLAFSNKSEKDLERARQTTDIIQLVEELDRLMEQHPELKPLARHRGYRTVKRLQAPINIVEITNTGIGGAADFSAAAIEGRRIAGHAAAEKASTAALGAESAAREVGATT
jgi:predicted acylesterase/phospholipase RssA